MKVETRIVLKADEGKVLTDGEVYGRTVMLGESRSAEEFYEIDESEYNEIIKLSDDISEGFAEPPEPEGQV